MISIYKIVLKLLTHHTKKNNFKLTIFLLTVYILNSSKNYAYIQANNNIYIHIIHFQVLIIVKKYKQKKIRNCQMCK